MLPKSSSSLDSRPVLAYPNLCHTIGTNSSSCRLIAEGWEVQFARLSGRENRHARHLARPRTTAHTLRGGLSQGDLPPLEPGRVCLDERHRRAARGRPAVRERDGEAALGDWAHRARPLSRRAAHGAGAARGAPHDPPAPRPRGLPVAAARLRLGRRAYGGGAPRERRLGRADRAHGEGDRKSTRLNSSHANISYAVFCLKKKKYK